MRRWLLAAGFLLPLSVSSTASAQECPPGSWFCEEVKVQVGPKSVKVGADDDADAAEDTAPDAKQVADDADPDELAADPDESPKAAKKKKRKAKKQKRKRVEVDEDVAVESDADVVIVKKRKPKVVVVEEGEEGPTRKKAKRRWRERFGLNLRLEGAAFMSREDEGVAGMGGAGVSFRWRPSPYFAFDLGTDLIGGSDYNGDDRVEISGALSGLVYFNPQHRVQVYGIGGVHLSHAAVDKNSDDWGHGVTWTDDTVTRNYFGGQGGLGLEFRIARHFGMFVDGLAIIRTRIDSDEPEFVNSRTGETTNTSGAALFRTGVNFWW
jgi:opacity protein-like surface antigen